MSSDLQQLIEGRAKAIGMLALTRGRDELSFSRLISRAVLIDHLVEIIHGGRFSGRIFAVVVRAIKHAVKRPDQLQFRLGKIPDFLIDAQIPYCLIAVTMDDEACYFCWLKEPIRVGDAAMLKTILQPQWRKLDSVGSAEIVAAVNAWYDAQRQAQAA